MKKLQDFALKGASPWTLGEGPEADVVISTRIRLARNFADYVFPQKIEREQAMQVWKLVNDALQKEKGLSFYNLNEADATLRSALVEMHLISQEHAQKDEGYHGLLLGDQGDVAVMINEEDHVRLQVFAAGLDLESAWQEAQRLDDLIEGEARYAYDEKYGYLTACPTNLGTGLRASVLLHLPGLRAQNELGILNGLQAIGLTVRGLFGEGSESQGDLYQVSNQKTMGVSEEELIQTLKRATLQLVAVERQARKKMYQQQALHLEDTVWRAYGLLSQARLLSEKEAYRALSAVRCGIALKIIPDISYQTVDALLLAMQPHYLALEEPDASTAQKRATVIRAQLG